MYTFSDEIVEYLKDGNLDKLKEYHNTNEHQLKIIMLDIFIEWEQYETLKWFVENNFKKHHNAMNLAIIKGNFEIVKYLHDNNIKNKDALKIASGCVNFEILKFLHLNGYPSENAIKNAIIFEKYDHIDFLLEHYKPEDLIDPTSNITGEQMIMYYTFLFGDLKVLKFLWRKGLQFPPNINNLIYLRLCRMRFPITYEDHEDMEDPQTMFAKMDWIKNKEIPILFSSLENPKENICMVCHDEMIPETQIYVFKCQHFVCDDCYYKIDECPYHCGSRLSDPRPTQELIRLTD